MAPIAVTVFGSRTLNENARHTSVLNVVVVVVQVNLEGIPLDTVTFLDPPLVNPPLVQLMATAGVVVVLL